MDAVEQIAAEVVRLAQAGGLPPLYVVAFVVVLALLLVALRAAGRLDWRAKPSEPPLKPGVPVTTGEGGQLVDGNGRPVTIDPDNAGGGPTGGMG